MSALIHVGEVQSVHALAHRLYCQTRSVKDNKASGQTQLEDSKSIARSLRKLRNKLEEADEALDEAPAQHEDLRVLQASGESRTVLNILDQTLHHHLSAKSQGTPDEGFVLDFITLLESVTTKLSDALAALEGQKGTSSLAEPPFPTPAPSSAIRSSSASTASDRKSFHSGYYSLRPEHASTSTNRTSLGGERDQSTENGVDAAIPRIVERQKTADNRLEEIACQSGRPSSAFADPMSAEIDQATSMILREGSQDGKCRYRIVNPDAPKTDGEHDSEGWQTYARDLADVPSSLPVPQPQAIPNLTFDAEQQHQDTAGTRQDRSTTEIRTATGQAVSRSDRPYGGGTFGVDRTDTTVNVAAMSLKPTLSISGIEVVEDGRSGKRATPRSQVTVEEKMVSHWSVASLEARDVKEVCEGYAHTDQIFEQERIMVISAVWNDSRWTDAEEQITSHIQHQTERNNFLLVRKLRHLLGVIASLQGRWHRALQCFISVLNGPISEPSQLDAGDCAAAYWLGDIYALLNRRVEALLAYSIAERSPIFQDLAKHRLHQCIRADQDACRAGNGASDIKLWEQERLNINFDPGDSILDPQIITGTAARAFLSYVRWQPEAAPGAQYTLEPNDGRAFSLWKVGLDAVPWQEMQRLRIDPTSFTPSGAWPLPFDPLFAMANVSNGRLLSPESDLYQLATANHKLPKASGLSRKMDCFTHPDGLWLILTIRKCLRWLEVEWTEHSTSETALFASRYSNTEDNINTINYFSLSIFRLSLRSGYGIDICPGGVSSARIIRREANFEKGVHAQETKRVKKLIRDFLEHAARKQEEEAFRGTALPVMSLNGVTGLQRRPTQVHRKSTASAATSSAASTKSGSSSKKSRPVSLFSRRSGA